MPTSRRAPGLVLLAALVLLGGRPVAAQTGGHAPDAGLARYRDGQVALAGGEFDLARVHFESVPATSILGDYAAFFVAETLLRAGDEATALERFRVFVDRLPDSTLAPQAVLALADTAFRMGHWAEAEREARRFLARAPTHPEAARILVRLAEARAAQGLVGEAIADLRRRWIEAPASAWGEVAREVMEDLAALHRVPVPPLSGEERLLQAQRYAEASDFAAAARVFDELLGQGLETAFRHRALVQVAPVLGRLQRGPEAIVLLQGALVEPASP